MDTNTKPSVSSELPESLTTLSMPYFCSRPPRYYLMGYADGQLLAVELECSDPETAEEICWLYSQEAGINFLLVDNPDCDPVTYH